MKCKREHWVQALDLLKHAVDLKSTRPAMYECVVSADGDNVTISATDLVTEIDVRFPGDGKLPSRIMSWDQLTKLSKAPKKARDEMMTVTDRKGNPPGLRLTIGKRKFEISASTGKMEDRPLPRVGKGPEALEAFDSQTLVRALKYLLPAVCNDESRFHLCGNYLDGSGGLFATDGHRLHGATSVGGFSSTAPEPVTFRSGRAIMAAVKATNARFVMGRLFLGSGEKPVRGLVEFSIDGVFLSVMIRERPVDGEYPPVDQVIPTHTDSYTVSRAKFADCLDTAIKVKKASAPGGDGGVKLLANGVLSVSNNSFTEVLELLSKAPVEREVGVEPRYMLEALKTDGDVVEVFYGEALEPIKVVAGDDLFAVVMPMRI